MDERRIEQIITIVPSRVRWRRSVEIKVSNGKTKGDVFLAKEPFYPL